jgi:hypothetical protein
MAVRHFQLALAAAAQRLSDVYGGVAGANPDAAEDLPYRQILFSAAGADAFVGDDADVASTDYGAIVDSTALTPVVVGPFETGPVKLSQFWAAGAGSTLHILAIPF